MTDSKSLVALGLAAVLGAATPAMAQDVQCPIKIDVLHSHPGTMAISAKP